MVEMSKSAMDIFKRVVSHKWTKWQPGLSRMLLSTADIMDSVVTCCKDVGRLLSLQAQRAISPTKRLNVLVSTLLFHRAFSLTVFIGSNKCTTLTNTCPVLVKVVHLLEPIKTVFSIKLILN
jgi:hypothetical protein